MYLVITKMLRYQDEKKYYQTHYGFYEENESTHLDILQNKNGLKSDEKIWIYKMPDSMLVDIQGTFTEKSLKPTTKAYVRGTYKKKDKPVVKQKSTKKAQKTVEKSDKKSVKFNLKKKDQINIPQVKKSKVGVWNINLGGKEVVSSKAA